MSSFPQHLPRKYKKIITEPGIIVSAIDPFITTYNSFNTTLREKIIKDIKKTDDKHAIGVISISKSNFVYQIEDLYTPRTQLADAPG